MGEEQSAEEKDARAAAKTLKELLPEHTFNAVMHHIRRIESWGERAARVHAAIENRRRSEAYDRKRAADG